MALLLACALLDAGPALARSGPASTDGLEPVSQEPSPQVVPGPAAAVATAEPSSTAQPPDGGTAPRKRGARYVAGWIGYGGGAVQRRGGSTDFAPVLGLPFPQSAGLGVGVPVGRRLLVGGEWNITLGLNCGVASINSATGPCDRAVLLQHLLATATFFPLWAGSPEVAPAGFVLRGGAGLARLNSWYSADETGAAGPSVDAEPGAKNWTRTGAGVLAGLGYALGTAGARTVDVGLDFAWQWYGRSTSEPERSFSSSIHLGLAFH